MKVEKLQHRHGGRIVELSAVGHDTVQRHASWFFVGKVVWNDGGVSEAAEISPACLCRDQDDKAACAELDAAMQAMNDYLAKHGKWTDREWKPVAKRGKEVIA
jgi:hypothetical protein